MSYILDALKRAEAERSRGEVPNIHAPAVPVGDTAHEGPGPTSLVWLGAGLGLVLLAVAGWWGWSASPAVVPGGIAVGPSMSGAPPSPAAPPRTTPPAPAPVRQAEAPQSTVAVSPTPSSPLVFKPLPSDPVADPPPRSAVARPASEERVFQLKDLPSDIRAALPSVAVGGASYSENPASRMLIINGQIYHEGDQLAPELTLQQIQLRSAVLSFRGYRYAISY